MALFTVNPELCKADGICQAICPARIIVMNKDAGIPEAVAGAESLCIGCGHCVAVCPNGALTHERMGPEDCLPVRTEWLLNEERVEHLLRSRRSIRSFKKTPVDRETLTRLIAVARYAPSGRNSQAVHWMVIHDSETVQTLAGHVVDWMRQLIDTMPEAAAAMNMDRLVAGWEAGTDVICRHAPHMVVAHGNKADQTAPTACTLALAYLDLAAPSFGLGTCWAGYFGAAATLWPPMTEALDLPPEHACFGAMMIGVPRFHYPRMPERNPPVVQWR